MEFVQQAYRVFSSMNTGIALLALIGTVSALGSAFMPNAFYRNPLFQLLLAFLFLNMFLCTVSQLASYCRYWRKRMNKCAYIRRLGVLILHAGIVVILVGGTVHAYKAQSEEITLIEGQTYHVSKAMRTSEPISLKLNKFEIEFNPDGSPAQYYSHLSILTAKDTKQTSISVNNPLSYAGIKAYQQSFGHLILAEVTGNGTTVTRLMREGEFLQIPGTKRVVKAYKYIPDFDPNQGMRSRSLRPDNPRVIYSVYKSGKLLGVGAAEFARTVEIDEGVQVQFIAVKPYTVLKIKSDPGLPVAGTGAVMLVVGVCLFYLPPRKVF